MIRFCDKEVYTVHLGEMTRMQMLLFFLNDNGRHISDVIVVLDEHGGYCGMTTYQTVLNNQEEFINKDVLIISENFWKDAQCYFSGDNRDLVAVMNKEGELLGFCYNDADRKYLNSLGYLQIFETMEKVPLDFASWNSKCQQICIMDCNELAWRCYKLFKKMGYPVCVIGEKWTWFGMEQLEGYLDYPEYARLYIYAEGTGYFRDSKYGDKRNTSVDMSFSFLRAWMDACAKAVCEKYVQELQKQGIYVGKCIIPDIDDVTVYTKDEMMSEKLKTDAHGYVLWKDCYSVRREENLEKIVGKAAFSNLQKGILQDMRGWRSVNYNNIVAQALENITFKNRIYLIGPCIVSGEPCVTEDTLAAQLQQLVYNWEYTVVKVFCPVTRADLLAEEIGKLPIRENDIVLFIDGSNRLERRSTAGEAVIELTDIYNDPQRETWFTGMDTRHLNNKGTKAVAYAIYNKYFKKVFESFTDIGKDNKYIQKGELLRTELKEELAAYVSRIREPEKNSGRIGAIIMNCNPFTYGHQYLIEYAAAHVDFLYVFVVEENRSYFSFEDRFHMVCAGTKHLENVKVVPSGKWVLSYDTLPIYFEKSERKEETIDANLDLEIFARYIAPAINVTVRFVGEEPEDRITRQYNEQMRDILNEFNIGVIEVPRREIEGIPISASRVRKAMETQKWEEVVQYVPQETYNVCKKIAVSSGRKD